MFQVSSALEASIECIFTMRYYQTYRFYFKGSYSKTGALKKTKGLSTQILFNPKRITDHLDNWSIGIYHNTSDDSAQVVDLMRIYILDTLGRIVNLE